jgi:hypothetical protein
MRIELDPSETDMLKDILQQKVTDLDREISATENLRFKGALRDVERRVEQILGKVTSAVDGGPGDWEPRDEVPDTPETNT